MQAVMHLTHYAVHPLMLMMALLTMPVLYFVKVHMPPVLFVTVVVAMILATSGPSTMYIISQRFIGNRILKVLLMIPTMMLIGTGLAVNNAKAVLEALFRLNSPFHRTPKKGEKRVHGYRPIKDWTCVFELGIGAYCLCSFYMFFGYTNFVVSPFLILYASGFIFVGLVSIVHFRKPHLIDIKVKPLNEPLASPSTAL
jgi:hypothetical protein